MISFILNDTTIETLQPAGMTLLDFIRYEKRLVGTKIGCREGDCGACTILLGELVDGQMQYLSMTSCITPLINVHGKHVVSIEGINGSDLTPVQQAIVDESGSQCGFCTVGFVVSLTGECLSRKISSYDDVVGAVDGNICRCTGYKSIERACNNIHSHLKEKDISNPIPWCSKNKIVPDYFNRIVERIEHIKPLPQSIGAVTIGGGTDLLVQKHDDVYESSIQGLFGKKDSIGIKVSEGKCSIGAITSVSELMESEEMIGMFPNLFNHMKLVASTPIRNSGTIGGNLVNASPIGDLTAFFLALNSSILIQNNNGDQRDLFLKDFYRGYKTYDLAVDEHLIKIQFDMPRENTHFNFEKVSKRTYLDIASVNSAMSIILSGMIISDIHISAGGVAPIPKYLAKTRAFLLGKILNEKTILAAIDIMQDEIAPISDARGTESYKRLLLRQLFWAHFLELFPEKFELITLKSVAQ
tara:strand:- start:1503 stop:2912 length:1410 start_codon:yes stop_codon:yes gene_type:complete